MGVFPEAGVTGCVSRIPFISGMLAAPVEDERIRPIIDCPSRQPLVSTGARLALLSPCLGSSQGNPHASDQRLLRCGTRVHQQAKQAGQ